MLLLIDLTHLGCFCLVNKILMPLPWGCNISLIPWLSPSFDRRLGKVLIGVLSLPTYMVAVNLVYIILSIDTTFIRYCACILLYIVIGVLM